MLKLWNWLNGNKTWIAVILSVVLSVLGRRGVEIPSWVFDVTDGILGLGLAHKAVKAVRPKAAATVVPVLLALLVLVGCATSATPAVQTVPTDAQQRAGSDYKVIANGWNSVGSVEEKARFGDEATRNNSTTLEIPFLNKDGLPVFNAAGEPVMVKYKGTGLRDIYIISAASGPGIDAHIEVQPGATASGTQDTQGSGTQTKSDTTDQKPSGTLTVPLSGK